MYNARDDAGTAITAVCPVEGRRRGCGLRVARDIPHIDLRLDSVVHRLRSISQRSSLLRAENATRGGHTHHDRSVMVALIRRSLLALVLEVSFDSTTRTGRLRRRLKVESKVFERVSDLFNLPLESVAFRSPSAVVRRRGSRKRTERRRWRRRRCHRCVWARKVAPLWARWCSDIVVRQRIENGRWRDNWRERHRRWRRDKRVIAMRQSRRHGAWHERTRWG